MNFWMSLGWLALAGCAGAQVVSSGPARSPAPGRSVIVYEIGSPVPAGLERQSVLGYPCEDVGDPQHNVFIRGALVDKALDQKCVALQFLGARYERIPDGRSCTFEAACLTPSGVSAR